MDSGFMHQKESIRELLSESLITLIPALKMGLFVLPWVALVIILIHLIASSY